jgi:hypothetical protein
MRSLGGSSPFLPSAEAGIIVGAVRAPPSKVDVRARNRRREKVEADFIARFGGEE